MLVLLHTHTLRRAGDALGACVPDNWAPPHSQLRHCGKVCLLFTWILTLGSRKLCICSADLGVGAVCVSWEALLPLNVQAWRMTTLTSLVNHLLCTEQCVERGGEPTSSRPGPALQWVNLEKTQVKQSM